ncbi:MAG: two-component system response regulator [Desulfuromonas sp.]|nr:MAG: two-component system response regulator [Desulfuromonas sp.]
MGKKILMVDDSASVRQMMSFTLQNAGYEVIEARDGKEALDMYPDSGANMLITDLNMPKMDGYGLIEEVRRRQGSRFLPIIMLTTESEQGKKDQAKALGASGWITKPFRPDQLLKVVGMVLGN